MSGAATLLEDSCLHLQVAGLSRETLVPIELQAHEAISTPFEITLVFVSETPRLDPDAFLSRAVLITAQHDTPAPRYFHGAARRFTTLGPDGRGNWHYAIEVVPQIWFMSQAENCRFFENRSVKDIVGTLLSDVGVSFSFRLIEAPPVREYTVQYNETDLAFISRLMEEAGYFYYFQHTLDGHELIIADSNVVFRPIPEPNLVFRPGLPQFDSLGRLQAWKVTATGTVTLADYDPSGVGKPQPHTESTILGTSGASARAVYHWPALAYENAELTARARRRIEAAEAFAALNEGEGWHECFVPGGTFTLAEDPLTGQRDAVFVIRSVTHHATNPYHLASDTRDAGPSYTNKFSAFPSATTWRQPLTVPRPRMAGVYAAVVIGPAGEEIYHDNLARVKVQFPWSHLGDTTPGGAMWVRVMKSWAGGGWGTQFIPRIGTEVTVAFVDGDPDRPMVIGSMYNAGSDPVYDPSEKTKTGWRSRSSPSGGSSNYSEFTMEDAKGSERIFLHAERDYVAEVEHDHNLTVDNCRIVTVKVNEQRTIEQNQTTKIGQNESFTVGNNSTCSIGNDEQNNVGNNRSTTIGTGDSLMVGANRTTTIGADHLVKIGANQTTTIGSDETLTIGGGQTTTIGAGDVLKVGADQVMQIGGGQSVTIGSSQSVTVGAAQLVQVGSGYSLTATSGDIGLNATTGNIALNASAGAIGLSAPQMISLSCGPSSISLTPMGVSIMGLSVSIDGVFVSTLSVLWSVLGVLAMVQGALVTLNSGAAPGDAAGGAVDASADADALAEGELAVAGTAGKAESILASDMSAAVTKGANAAAQRSGFLANAAKAAGRAYGKVSSSAAGEAFGKVADALGAAKTRTAAKLAASADKIGAAYSSGAYDTLAKEGLLAGKEALMNTPGRFAGALQQGGFDAVRPMLSSGGADALKDFNRFVLDPSRSYAEHEGSESLDQTNATQTNATPDDAADDEDATVNLAPRQPAPGSGGTPASNGNNNRGQS